MQWDMKNGFLSLSDTHIALYWELIDILLVHDDDTETHVKIAFTSLSRKFW